jgi:hypothetical protein
MPQIGIKPTVLVLLVFPNMGCIVLGGTQWKIQEGLMGAESICRIDGKVEIRSEMQGYGTPEMRVNGRPTSAATMILGDKVNLPIFNGRADYRLKAIKNNVLVFAADEWFWACTGPFLIHSTANVTVVTNQQAATTTRPQ